MAMARGTGPSELLLMEISRIGEVVKLFIEKGIMPYTAEGRSKWPASARVSARATSTAKERGGAVPAPDLEGTRNRDTSIEEKLIEATVE